MKTAADVANQVLMPSGDKQANRSSKAEEIPQKAIDRLFMRFQAIYRQKWSSQLSGNTTRAYRAISAEWIKTLAGLSMYEITAGLERMKDTPRFDEWPPTPMQFRRLCRPHRQPYEREQFQAKRLPQRPADKASSLAHIAQIRNRLVGTKGANPTPAKGAAPDHDSF